MKQYRAKELWAVSITAPHWPVKKSDLIGLYHFLNEYKWFDNYWIVYGKCQLLNAKREKQCEASDLG